MHTITLKVQVNKICSGTNYDIHSTLLASFQIVTSMQYGTKRMHWRIFISSFTLKVDEDTSISHHTREGTIEMTEP